MTKHGDIRRAFHTEIHYLEVKGERHFANMSDPQNSGGAGAGRSGRGFPAQFQASRHVSAPCPVAEGRAQQARQS